MPFSLTPEVQKALEGTYIDRLPPAVLDLIFTKIDNMVSAMYPKTVLKARPLYNAPVPDLATYFATSQKGEEMSYMLMVTHFELLCAHNEVIPLDIEGEVDVAFIQQSSIFFHDYHLHDMEEVGGNNEDSFDQGYVNHLIEMSRGICKTIYPKPAFEPYYDCFESFEESEWYFRDGNISPTLLQAFSDIPTRYEDCDDAESVLAYWVHVEEQAAWRASKRAQLNLL